MRLEFKDCVIKHDGVQYILSVKRISKGEKSKGQEVESTIGYYSNEQQLTRGLIKYGMSDEAIRESIHIDEMIIAATNHVTQVLGHAN